ncbi:uncharacterized protein LOC133513670 [Syngnathoides biaculeatus]|uniref:uncharacterized protein LOC133513670 n=1 Tax=Syngnathoides biaculeatus TaxID=300417 RepID=UPI002ADDB44C|nr:uncharacterized protein LOC133513670 [Syngnathoides biaculeatus]XP_061700618.1 uncharacterized protein LOC133513670 [Syngnathoides biaculeatus]XP_061700619.1 uncharacterized protein LOC133513670 [Syngnathoides biaculeatus]XP_061700620.1 uncharacterized protein LOC133513670 [Syngnathoides biaculeatus]
MESRLISGIESKKIKKEKERSQKLFLKLKKDELFRGEPGTWDMAKLARQLQKKESRMLADIRDMKEDQSQVGWRQRNKLEKEVKKLEKDRRGIHQLATIATVLVAIKEEKSENEVKKEDEVIEKVEEKTECLRGIYPQLSDSRQYVFAPPPYQTAPVMAPVVTLGGRMVLDVEDEGSRMAPATIQLIEQAVNNERKGVRGKKQGSVESPVLAPGAELAGDGGTTSAGTLKLMKTEASRKLFEGQKVQSEEREMLEEVMTGTQKHGQAMPSDADHREEEMESDEEDEVVLREQRQMLRALSEGERLGDSEESMSRAERGYNTHSKGKMMAQQEQPQTMAPLVVTHAGLHYEPLVLRDVAALVEKLPPLHKGARAWITKFLAAMSGQGVALGDFRQAILGPCSLIQLQNIEGAAGTRQLGRETPPAEISEALFRELRAAFPSPVDVVPTIFNYGKDVTSEQHYAQALELWIETTGKHPGSYPEAEMMFRTAMLNVLPNEVQAIMRIDPDILVCPEPRFKRHLIHHCRIYMEKANKNQKETDALATGLVKVQLAKLHGEAKQEKVKQKQMYQTPVGAGWGQGFRGGYRESTGSVLPSQPVVRPGRIGGPGKLGKHWPGRANAPVDSGGHSGPDVGGHWSNTFINQHATAKYSVVEMRYNVGLLLGTSSDSALYPAIENGNHKHWTETISFICSCNGHTHQFNGQKHVVSIESPDIVRREGTYSDISWRTGSGMLPACNT